ncbi:YhfT family protein [Streptomyces clavuligerus]|uniref:Putative permease protein n=4 Tax=Streptomyces clavuligerus TaxID=1901 RepID=E2Q190_STRCL|nr:YhfT family protein [Streptomyces clavuligerus]ANW18733.1 permease [Streptomyces clavuligerus]AXU13299.1 permease [Streptomyces clavuligerus]EFG08595.1 Putative permease protein [Streptomyces clavuligerus]MBY6303251.1 permease [Streptomyces clavuligerus]QCS06083.1 permease [Streptomyces clavuligerus]
MHLPIAAAPVPAPPPAGLDFTAFQQGTVIGLCALTALVSHLAFAVFNDGVRPFLLDFVHGRTTRNATAAVAFGLSAGFVFGLGAPMALSSGVLNPWLLFLPTDVLGLLAPGRVLALLLGAAWGAVVVFGLDGANDLAHDLPVDFLTAMQQMSTPILFLFTLFPVLAIVRQFGRAWGAVAGALELSLVVATMKLWPNMFAGALAMAVGVLLLVSLAVARDLRLRREQAAAQATRPTSGAAGAAGAAADPLASLFSAGAARLRRFLPLFALLGAGVAVLAQSHVFGGGEATSFLIAKGEHTEAAQVDFYRAFGFLPLIATTALASGAYAIAGFTFVYPLGYLMPSALLAAGAGALVLTVEVLALSALGRLLGRLPTVRDSSEHLRGAITETLLLAILFGSLMAANAMGGGLGILIVGGLYLLNEAMGRPLVRMAAAPAAVLAGGVLLNLLHWLGLFTPVAA